MKTILERSVQEETALPSGRVSPSDNLLTVIIPTWNRRELLRGCLSALERQTAACRVLVVDNGSSDGTAEMVRTEYPAANCLRLASNQGFAAAVNIGIRSSDTDYIALLNNDTEPDEGWVKAGVEALRRHPRYEFFASRIVNFFERAFLDSAGDCYTRAGLPFKRGSGAPVGDFSQPEEVLGASAGAAFYRRSLFDRVGLFDERFVIYLEDVDLSLRAQLSGFRCLFIPDAVVYHMEGASDREWRRRKQAAGKDGRMQFAFYSSDRVFWITRNRWLLMMSYQPLRNAPRLSWGWTRSLLFHLLKAGYSGAFLRGIGSGISHTPYALRKRRALAETRTLSSRELCELMQKC